MYFDGELLSAALYRRERLSAGAKITGPAIVVEPLTTTIIDPGWQASVLSGGELLLTHLNGAAAPHSAANISQSALRTPQSSPDPILLEVFNNHFTAIATQMGITLRNTAMSVNVKERLDFSLRDFHAARRSGRQCSAYSRASGRDEPDGQTNPPR